MERTVDDVCHFFRLSPELRDIIYEMVLRMPGSCLSLKKRKNTHGSNTIEERYWRDDDAQWMIFSKECAPTILALLGVNRQINHEAQQMFYALNTLFLEPRYNERGKLDILPTLRFTKQLNKTRLMGVETIFLYLGYRVLKTEAAVAACKAFAALPRLKTLHIMIYVYDDDRGDYSQCWKKILAEKTHLKKAFSKLKMVEDFRLVVGYSEDATTPPGDQERDELSQELWDVLPKVKEANEKRRLRKAAEAQEVTSTA